MISKISVGFGDIFVTMNFLVMEPVPLDLSIRDSTQINLGMKIDKHQSTVKVWAQGKTETLSLIYEPDAINCTDDDFNSCNDTEEECGADSEDDDYATVILIVNKNHNELFSISVNDEVYKKLCHLDQDLPKTWKPYSRDIPMWGSVPIQCRGQIRICADFQ